jgi:hypothetical protein
MTRTVVKANYKQARGKAGSSRAKGHARASADYYSTRPDGEGSYQERTGFSAEESNLDHADIEQKLEEAEGTYFYRAVLSPGQDIPGENLEEWARDVMEDFDGDWVGFVHDDQTEHNHVHIIAFCDEKLSRGDFQEMRELGDKSFERHKERQNEWQSEAKFDAPDYGQEMDVT